MKLLSFVVPIRFLTLKHTQHTVEDTFKSVEENCVSETVKDGPKIS